MTEVKFVGMTKKAVTNLKKNCISTKDTIQVLETKQGRDPRIVSTTHKINFQYVEGELICPDSTINRKFRTYDMVDGTKLEEFIQVTLELPKRIFLGLRDASTKEVIPDTTWNEAELK